MGQIIFKLLLSVFFFTSCETSEKSKIDKWTAKFCNCVNMPTVQAQTGCLDTWRVEMKKELNSEDEKKCWIEIEKLKNGDCSSN
jgi:hypothetical protein